MQKSGSFMDKNDRLHEKNVSHQRGYVFIRSKGEDLAGADIRSPMVSRSADVAGKRWQNAVPDDRCLCFFCRREDH